MIAKNNDPHNLGSLVRALLSARLVDELKLLVNPHIEGTGDRLFSEKVLSLRKCSSLIKV